MTRREILIRRLLPQNLVALIHEQGRAAEWVTSLVMLDFGLTLLLPGETMSISSSYAAFRSLGLDDAALGAPVVAVALMRIAALYINGNWRRTPLLRGVGAVIGAVFFASLLASFSFPKLTGIADAWNTGTTYAVLALFDLFSSYRAGADAGRAR